MTAKPAPSVLVQILSGGLWLAAGLTLIACLSARHRLSEAFPDAGSRTVGPGQEMKDTAEDNDLAVAGDRGEIKPMARPPGASQRASPRHGIHWPAPSLRVPITMTVEPVPVPLTDIDLSAQPTRRGPSIR